mgnify:CR=1 FL=1
MKKLFFLWNKLTATFWFIPCLIILGSILLSMILVDIDSITNFSNEGIKRSFFVNSSDSARSILVTIAAAMMGVAGTVFSVTLVALTLASSQFGPRLIKNFMYVRLNQVVLGAYVSTYLYCLLVLNAVKDREDFTFIPSLSILVAIVAAIGNIVLIIIFIHRIAISIQADKIISDIADFMAKQVERLFPMQIGQESAKDNAYEIEKIKTKYAYSTPIKSMKSGYLQYIDGDSLIKQIVKIDGVLVIDFRPGKFLVAGMEMGKMYSNVLIEEKDLNKMIKQFVIGKTKMAQQDLEYSIHQMVEVAVRALSPGVNDPFTAIVCIDNLSAILCQLAQINLPSRYRCDAHENLRVVVDTFNFEGIVDASFNQIRQFSSASPAVMIRLMEALLRINEFAQTETHKKVINKHARMVLNLGKETIIEPNDLKDLIARSRKIL